MKLSTFGQRHDPSNKCCPINAETWASNAKPVCNCGWGKRLGCALVELEKVILEDGGTHIIDFTMDGKVIIE